MTSKDFSQRVKEEAISVPFTDLKLSVPSKLLVIGPSGSGKTRNNVFSLTDNKWHLQAPSKSFQSCLIVTLAFDNIIRESLRFADFKGKDKSTLTEY